MMEKMSKRANHRHDHADHGMRSDRIRFELQRSFYAFRKGPVWLVILFELAALGFVFSKGAGKIYLDLLPAFLLVTLLSGFMVAFIHGNQKIWLMAQILLTVGMMLQSIFKQEYILKHPDAYEGGSAAAGLQLQLLVALAAALVVGFLYWNLRECSTIRIAEILTVVSILLSLLTLVLAKSVGNVKNWLTIGGMSFQTTEVVKFLYLFIAAALLGTVERPDKRRLTAFYVVSFIQMGFLVLQSEFGTLLLLLMVFLTFLFLFVPEVKVFVITFCGMMGAFLVAALTGLQLEKLAEAGSPVGTNKIARFYLANFHKIANRFIYWKHPEKDPLSQGYQLIKARESIVLGGWFGTSSVTNLPVKTSDLVFPALIQRCGMIFALLVFLVFILLWLEGMKVCVRKGDKYHQMMAVGLISMFIDQTIIIIAGSTGLCPLTGITLPFISSGGSSLVVSFMLLSVLLCISGNLSWKGQSSEEIEFFKKVTDGAERVLNLGHRYVCILVQNISTSAGNLKRGRQAKGGRKTGDL